MHRRAKERVADGVHFFECDQPLFGKGPNYATRVLDLAAKLIDQQRFTRLEAVE